jgi:hypothetical protein
MKRRVAAGEQFEAPVKNSDADSSSPSLPSVESENRHPPDT